ncbi:MAG: hypothetical protein NT009_05450 [Proteobacteria bacterium]|nr:hypothetical protein [Pseudomonadota bacterium]
MKSRRIAFILWAWLVLLSACGGKDKSPPVTTADPPGGYYCQSLEITLIASEPALFYYSVDVTRLTAPTPPLTVPPPGPVKARFPG